MVTAMTRTIQRTYELSRSEVREAIIALMKSKGMPTPSYVGNTDTCTWEDKLDGSVVIVWSETDDLALP